MRELLALVPSERVVSLGRRDDDDVRIDFAAEFDVTAIPVDVDRYAFAVGYLVIRPLAQQTFAASFAINLTSVVRDVRLRRAEQPARPNRRGGQRILARAAMIPATFSLRSA
jgi:hypothetical protein